MNCIILAGGNLADTDPLYRYTNNRPKALLTIGRKTLLQHVITAVQPVVDSIIICGLESDLMPELESGTIVLPNFGSMVRNVEQGLKRQLVQFGRNHTLVVTADLPQLSAEAIEHFVALCQPLDHLGYYSMVPKFAIDKRYPEAQRTYGKLRERVITGGNIALLHTDLLNVNLARCEQLVGARKSALQLARQVGPVAILKLLARRLTVNETGQIASKMFNAPLKAIVSPYAELAMDVDKPHDLELLRLLYSQQDNKTSTVK